MDVQVHGGLSRDGLAGRSPATGAAPGAGMLVHPITCDQKGETRRAEPVDDEEDGEADPSLRLASLVLLANQKQHSESFLSFSLCLSSSWCLLSLALRESE